MFDVYSEYRPGNALLCLLDVWRTSALPCIFLLYLLSCPCFGKWVSSWGLRTPEMTRRMFYVSLGRGFLALNRFSKGSLTSATSPPPPPKKKTHTLKLLL